MADIDEILTLVEQLKGELDKYRPLDNASVQWNFSGSKHISKK